MNKYEQQGIDFLKSTSTEIKVEFSNHGHHFNDETDTRDIYKITLTRGGREFIFNFGQSIASSGFKLVNTNTNKEVLYKWDAEAQAYANMDLKRFKWFVTDKIGTLGCYKAISPKEPTSYDVITCLTTYDPETFKDFCDSYDYDVDSIKAQSVYVAVCDEYKNVCLLWNENEIEQLREIQ
jgi:hypothetical protein